MTQTTYDEISQASARTMKHFIGSQVRGKVTVFFDENGTLFVCIAPNRADFTFRTEIPNFYRRIVLGESTIRIAEQILKKYRSHIVNRFFITN